MEDYWAEVKRFIVDWQYPTELEGVCTEADIQKAEKKLGFRLPEAMREFYLQIEHHTDIFSPQELVAFTDSGDEFILYEHKKIKGNVRYVSFYQDWHMGAGFFLDVNEIALGNPPVWFGDSEGESTERGCVFTDFIHQWLIMHLVWISDIHTVQEKEKYFISDRYCIYKKNINEEILKLVEDKFVKLFDYTLWGHVFYRYRDLILVVNHDMNFGLDKELYVLARKQGELEDALIILFSS
jgi:SMI1 / KNR4 family (SUKH-1)